jgi:hypothetical protein
LLTCRQAVWKFVRNWSRRTLEKASDRVVDVQGDDDFEEVPPTTDGGPRTAPPSSEAPNTEATETESRKTQ